MSSNNTGETQPRRPRELPPGHSIGGFAHEIFPASKQPKKVCSNASAKTNPNAPYNENDDGSIFESSWKLNAKLVAGNSQETSDSSEQDQPNFRCIRAAIPWTARSVVFLVFFPVFLLAWLAYAVHRRKESASSGDGGEHDLNEGHILTSSYVGSDRLVPPQVGCM